MEEITKNDNQEEEEEVCDIIVCNHYLCVLISLIDLSCLFRTMLCARYVSTGLYMRTTKSCFAINATSLFIRAATT